MDYTTFPAFRDLTPEQFRHFLSIGQYGKIPSGQKLIRQAAVGTHLFFIFEGEVRVYLEDELGEQELNSITAPTVLGEISFFSGKASSANVASMTEVKASVVPFKALRDRLYAGDAAAAIVLLNLASTIAERAAAMTHKVSEFYTHHDEVATTAKDLFGEWSFL